MLRTSDLEYDLPVGRIATHPAEPRDSARLMVVERARGTVEHRGIRDLPLLLRRGDLLVTNASRVLPARFLGVREDTGGGVEGLYLREGPRAGTWVVMLKARRFKPGMRVRLAAQHGNGGGGAGVSVVLTLLESPATGDGTRLVEVSGAGGLATPAILERVGVPPIPPYILGARRGEAVDAPGESVERAASNPDADSYQTVFAGGLVASADGSECGSVAAPTAGLHFTPGLMDRLAAAGVDRAEVVLHVGPGTFKPVEAEIVERHPMHAEWCMMPAATREAMERARARGGRVVCVGTTSARTVEAFALRAAEGDDQGEEHRPQACATNQGPGLQARATSQWLHTRLLITPGFAWRGTDALLTNFHLPRSTLMALVGAMLPGGVEELKRLYTLAIEKGYRFYSYGDAMLIV